MKIDRTEVEFGPLSAFLCVKGEVCVCVGGGGQSNFFLEKGWNFLYLKEEWVGVKFIS